MNLHALIDAFKGMSYATIRLALLDSQRARTHLSRSLLHYDELMGYGLPPRDPVEFLVEKGWGQYSPSDRVHFPTDLRGGGGTGLDELVHLATATQVLRPKKIFEIGTFMGRTTSILILNAPADSVVFSLDLPPGAEVGVEKQSEYIDSDLTLIKRRKLARLVYDLGLEGRYHQVLCNSLEFDPAPHQSSVELGFIDGAHALQYVQNDTEKMARMMAGRGLVFWHDYGGKGRMRPLSTYLERLAEKFPIYRVPDTSLAWASAEDVRAIADQPPG